MHLQGTLAIGYLFAVLQNVPCYILAMLTYSLETGAKGEIRPFNSQRHLVLSTQEGEVQGDGGGVSEEPRLPKLSI